VGYFPVENMTVFDMFDYIDNRLPVRFAKMIARVPYIGSK